MARTKKAESTKATKVSKATAAKQTRRKKVATSVDTKPQRTGFTEYMRFGESYTSLILGIIVVIIATALLLSFVNNRNSLNNIPPVSDQVENLAISDKPIRLTPSAEEATDAAMKAMEQESEIKENDMKADDKKEVAMKPEEKKAEVKKEEPKKEVMKAEDKKEDPKQAEKKEVSKDEKTWTVQEGESLWSIAEKHYESGYNWVDIAKANNLNHPGDISKGDKLVLPKVEKKVATIAKDDRAVTGGSTKREDSSNAIKGDSYTIARGDTLWSIAVRAYGDGYKWTEIAKANNLSNPGVIHADNKLKLPRSK